MDESTVRILHRDKNCIVCVKPAGVSSEEGNPPDMPGLLKSQTGLGNIYTVHRLDTPTRGLMVYACSQEAAADLSRQITEGVFSKEYYCVVHGRPEPSSGRMDDLLFYDRQKGKTFVVDRGRRGVKSASLEYTAEKTCTDTEGNTLTLVRVKLLTGRTHQIRAQFASRKMPVCGDARYGSKMKTESIALQSSSISFSDRDGQPMSFSIDIPDTAPWNLFEEEKPVLRMTDEGLALEKGNLSLRADFADMLPRIAKNRLGSEVIVKAARFRDKSIPLTAIDATAGLGEDSFLLAAAGFTVTMYERNPVIAALLRDALGRAEKDDRLREICSRMTLVEGDSIAAMNAGAGAQLVLLDPMFPQRQKSGLIKKKFQLLQLLEAPETDEKELLEAAGKAAVSRIMIKRPHGGPYLADENPSYSIDGGNIRIDCFACAQSR